MENLIVIEDGEKYKYDSIEEFVTQYIHKEYYSMNDDEKMQELEMKAMANTLQFKISVINLRKDGIKSNIYNQDAFVIYDEITHILSLMKIGKIVVLENVESQCFNKYINMENITDNYVIVNKFVNEIMEKYLNDIEV